MIFLQIFILVLGFVVLEKGADFFVDGSSGIARRFHISPLLIGLTIVAFGTSLPELAVSVTAAIDGSGEIAFSNVIVSNIFNLLGILGLCALIHPLPVNSSILRRDIPFSFFTTLLSLIVIAFPAIFQGIFFSLGMEEFAGSVSRHFSVIR